MEEKNLHIPLEILEVEDIKKMDTVQNDEALKVVGRYGGSEAWTDDEEKKILRKINRELMPILCVTYGLQFYDKFMLSEAVSFNIIP